MLFADAPDFLPQSAVGWAGWIFSAVAVPAVGFYFWVMGKRREGRKQDYADDLARRVSEAEQRKKEEVDERERRAKDEAVKDAANAYAIATYKELYENSEKRGSEAIIKFRDYAQQGEQALQDLTTTHVKEVRELNERILALTSDLATARALLVAKGPP